MKNKLQLNESINTLIIATTLSNIIFCILASFPNINYYTSLYVNLFSFIGFTAFGLIIKYFLNKNTNTNSVPPQSTNNSPIPRECHYLSLMDESQIIILYGDSGVGKTKLLEQLISFLESKNIKSDYINNTYYSEKDINSLGSSEYIILDQFEKALYLSNIKRLISILENKHNEKKHIIISIRKEYLADILHLFNTKNVILYWLDINESEKEHIKIYLSEIACCTLEDIDNKPLYLSLLKNIIDGTLSLIQLDNICKEIQYLGENFVEDKLKHYNNNYDDVIEDYFKKVLDDYKYSSTAYQILYILCLDPKGLLINSITDFQNICIQSEDIIKEVLEFLKSVNFISTVKSVENKYSDKLEYYEISHDYFFNHLSNICKNKIDEKIKSNIEYYNITIQLQRYQKNGFNDHKKEKRQKINQKCIDFLNKQKKNYVDISLIFILIGSIIINIITNSNNPLSINNYLSQACFFLLQGISLFYVYNYFYHFLSIFKYKYSIIMLFVAICSSFPFCFPKLWCVPFGVTIFITGIFMLIISKNIESKEKKFFIDRFCITCAIGFIVTILGFFNYIYTENLFWKALPLYILYICYMIICVAIHINKTYLHAILCKSLYGQKFVSKNNSN